jgi:hypothetical protein
MVKNNKVITNRREKKVKGKHPERKKLDEKGKHFLRKKSSCRKESATFPVINQVTSF